MGVEPHRPRPGSHAQIPSPTQIAEIKVKNSKFTMMIF